MADTNLDSLDLSDAAAGLKIAGTKVLGAQVAAIVSLTHAVGTGDDTVADVGASFNQGTLNNNFRDLSDKIQEILVALRAHGIIAS